MGTDSTEPVTDAAHTLVAALAAAEALIGVHDQTGTMFVTGGEVESSPPWNAAAAAAVLDAHYGLRRLERSVRAQVTGTVIVRGGSEGNTMAAIAGLVDLAPALPRVHAVALARSLDRLAGAAMALPAVDQAPSWLPIRLPDGTAPPPCPYCLTPNLRLNEAYGIIACLKPNCPAGGADTRPWAQPGRDERGYVRWTWPDGTVQP